MARIANETERTLKRNEILDVAQRLVYTRGYEQMSIQDIINELKISKGAFYYYFDSKPALLEALIERLMKEAEQFLAPILQDPSLPALEKLERYFDTVARWKSARKSYLLGILRVWYADDNAIVRQKVTAGGVRWFIPTLTAVIQQGVHEGTIRTPFPAQVGEVVMALMMELGNSIARSILALGSEQDPLRRSEGLRQMEETVLAYTDAIERVLGAPGGSIKLFDPSTLREWIAE